MNSSSGLEHKAGTYWEAVKWEKRWSAEENLPCNKQNNSLLLESAIAETCISIYKYMDSRGAVMIPIPLVSLVLALILSWEVASF